MSPISQLESENKLIQKQYRAAAAISLTVLLGGAWFYHIAEKFSWVDSIYFCTITLTTIGYGDIVPTTTVGKIFTIFYVLIGIGIIASFANIFVKHAILRRQYKKSKSDKKEKA